jgi:hypothetical protein
MVIIPSNEATAREGNAISIDLVRPIFSLFFFFSYIEQKEKLQLSSGSIFQLLRLKEEESGIENKKKVTVGV